MRRRVGVMGATLLLTGCGLFIDLGAGVAVGATDPGPVTVGPAFTVSVGFAFSRTREVPVEFGVGLSGDALSLAIDDFDEVAFVAGLVGYADVMIGEVADYVAFTWTTHLTLASGGVPQSGEIVPGGAATLYSGLGFAFLVNPENETWISLTVGPYGAFFTHPGAYGGGQLRLRLSGLI